MKTLYLDCAMGAAGDMLTAALIELLPDPDAFIDKLNALSIPGIRFQKEMSVKCGITGTHISVTVHGVEESAEALAHSHPHSHSGMQEIEHTISHLNLPAEVREHILAVYGLIAEAESHVHGAPVSQIHFHEVGALDAVADITAVCLLMNALSPDEIVVSPIHVGSGHVKCAHGFLPVPAPATAYILKDVPIYSSDIKGELCTPTGAALLKHFATRFGDMPVMKTQAIGYGMGKKDFQAANCLRAMLGESEDKTDIVLELSCNVDDMTAEAVGFAMERLFEAGAREVYTVPIGMKKSRPGTLLHVMCQEQDREKMLRLLFQHTTTIGVREAVTRRYILERKIDYVQTPYGKVRRKTAYGYGVSRSKYEYDDLSRIAKQQNISLDEAVKALRQDSEAKASPSPWENIGSKEPENG